MVVDYFFHVLLLVVCHATERGRGRGRGKGREYLLSVYMCKTCSSISLSWVGSILDNHWLYAHVQSRIIKSNNLGGRGKLKLQGISPCHFVGHRKTACIHTGKIAHSLGQP